MTTTAATAQPKTDPAPWQWICHDCGATRNVDDVIDANQQCDGDHPFVNGYSFAPRPGIPEEELPDVIQAFYGPLLQLLAEGSSK